MTILKNKERNITRSLPFAEKQLGVDLKLTGDNDLEMNNLQDFTLIAGVPNVAQATGVKLKTEANGNRYHANVGVDYPIGDKTVNAIGLRFDILRSLRQDTRFDDVQVKVEVDGNVYFININLTILGTQIDVPLQFVAQN